MTLNPVERPWGPPLRRSDVWMLAIPDSPLILALIWTVTTAIQFSDQMLFPGADNLGDSPLVTLHLAGTTILATLIISAVGGLRASFVRLAIALMAMQMLGSVVWFLAEFVLKPDSVAAQWAGSAIWVTTVIGQCIFAVLVMPRGMARWRSAVGVGAFVITAFLPGVFYGQEASLRSLSYAFARDRYPRRDEANQPPSVDPEQLWGAQSGLVEAALVRATKGDPSSPQTYVIGIAAQGSQTLFENESKVAAQVLGGRFADPARVLRLSNGVGDLMTIPLATNSNLSAVAAGLAKRDDPERNLYVIYLTAHGGRDATLATDLPDYQGLTSLSAHRLAIILNKAGLRRRVIIVSSCYAASWIKPLATDDTIVIAAAAADRTSFGCSTDRKLTYFGEAFLRGPLSQGGSLADAFSSARKTVSGWEAKDKLTPSNPQAFVGRHMATVWNARQAPPPGN